MRSTAGGAAGSRLGCRGCGVCCDLYGHTVHAAPGDLARWQDQGRSDLLAHVGPDGTLWWTADKRARLDRCPFFAWQDEDHGGCAVHATKPAICQAYPTPLHGCHCVMGARFSETPGRAGGD